MFAKHELALGLIAVTAWVQPSPAQSSATDVLIQRARALDGQGRHDLAAADWRQVLLLEPAQPEALAAMASFYQNAGDTVNANRYLAQLRKAKPGDARLTQIPKSSASGGAGSDFEAAARMAAQHHYPEALELYRKAFHGTAPSGTWALSYYETQAAVPAELPQAVAGLRDLVKQYPANPSYRLALGRVLTYEPRTRLEGVELLAGLHGTAEQMEQARVAWKQAILWSMNGPAGATAKDYLARYPDEQLEVRLKGAEKTSHPIIAGQPEQGAAYEALRKGDLAQAQHLFEALLTIPPQRGKALAGLGYVKMQQQNFAAAQEHFEQAESAGYHAPEMSTSLIDARYWNTMQRGNRALENDDFSHALIAFDQAHAIKPAAPEALQGQAGVWMQQKQPEKALPLFEQAVKMEQDRPQGWIAWFDALVRSARSKEVIADQPYIAPETLIKLQSDPDYMAVLAAAQMDAGSEAEGRRLLAELAQVQDVARRIAAQLRSAELLAVNNPRVSARLAFDVIRTSPDNLDAWKLLVSDEHQAGRDQMALTVVDRMPAPVYQQATRDVDFVTMLAATHQAMGHYSTASNLLTQARSDAQGASANTIEAQTAALLLAEGNAQGAYKTYVKILRRSPNDSVAWNGIISALHQAKQDEDALTQVQQLPSEVAETLGQDPGFVQTLAAVYGATGHSQLAVQTMGRVLAHYQPGRNDAPYAVEAQYAWLLLNAGEESQLAATLSQLGRRTDLTAGQKQQTSDIWAAWSIRKAEKEEKSGNTKQALAILEMASQAYPSNGDVRRATAATYVRHNEGKLAFALYQQLNWTKATAVDYAGAVAAAGAAKQKEAGRQWLADGLEQFPNDTQLLTAAAQFEEGIGDNRKAEIYLRKVVANNSQIKLTQQLTGVAAAQPAPTAVTASDALARMLAPQNDPAAMQATAAPAAQAESLQDAISALPVIQHPPSEASSDSRPDSKQEPSPWLVRKSPAPVPHTEPIAWQVDRKSRWTVPVNDGPSVPVPAEFRQPDEASSATVTDASMTLSRTAGAEFAPAASVATPAVSSAPPAMVLGPGQQAQTELEGIASRYSAWMGGGTQLGSRSGQAGFDQLTRLEADFETSAVLGESARLTVHALPVVLSAGAADGMSNYSFGNSGAALIGQDHFQSGVGGELQLSTRTFDASLGFSPNNFYVSHLLGSISAHPSNFPLHFRVYRDQVKETMLSYAGEKDPLTGTIWGGVVASGAEGGLSLGSAQSGFYLDAGAAQLTGVHVNNNSRIYGSTGAYWTAYSNPYGVLKMGANLTGLHYAQNQRYFTFGQGGYFSPDTYVLLNAPFDWEGKPINRFAYSIKGSLGVQSFHEGTALPGSLIATDTTPTAQGNMGANYNLAMNLAYRLDEHWYVGGFVGVNNAHDYQDRTAGFAVKYMQRPQVEVEGGPTGLFNEQAIRPLIVP